MQQLVLHQEVFVMEAKALCDQPRCCPAQPCCALMLFPWISGVLGAQSSAGSWGSSLRPYVCCTIWQGTLTCQCHLQGLLYFIQPQLSIRDTKILLLGKGPAHWVSEFCTHILCSSKILRMVCLVFTGWSGILSSESPLSPFLLQMPFRHFP